MIEIKKYKPTDPTLKRFIKHFWINIGKMPALNHKLLPIRNIDLVINLSPQPLSIHENNAEISLGPCYFTGIMDQFKYIWKQPAASLELIGISFFPTGLYPFFGIPLSDFKNHIIDLALVDKYLSEQLVEKIKMCKTSFEKIQTLEQELLKLLDLNLVIDEKMDALIANFSQLEESTITDFCDTHGIHKRKLERLANKVLGTTPKTFLKINRFRKALHVLLNNEYNNLTDVAYSCGYYDQMHFIKEFKLFTGSVPTQFLAEKKALRQICDF